MVRVGGSNPLGATTVQPASTRILAGLRPFRSSLRHVVDDGAWDATGKLLSDLWFWTRGLKEADDSNRRHNRFPSEPGTEDPCADADVLEQSADDAPAHTVTLAWDGRQWAPAPPVPPTPQEAQARLERAVDDAIEEGFTVDSQDEDGYVLSRRAHAPWLTGTGVVAVSIAALITLFGSLILGLMLLAAVTVLWVQAARRRVRIAVYLTPTGQVVEEELYAEADDLDQAADDVGDAPRSEPGAPPVVPGVDAPAVTGPLVHEPVGSMLREWWQRYLDHRRNV